MRATTIAFVTLALLATLPAAIGGHATVTVTLDIMPTYHLLPPETTCELTVAHGADAGDVLDAAVAAECIDSWEYNGVRGQDDGRYVKSINGKEEQVGFFWHFFEDNRSATHGIDGAFAVQNSRFGFGYADWATGIAMGFLP